jgi:S-adenosylmethionine:diacylglycerol 3-amino-3-carboxypropyl transferase
MSPDVTEEEQVVRILKGLQWVRKQHGSLYDRGCADSYYDRVASPHYGGMGGELREKVTDLTDEERMEYMAGYMYNERYGDKKEWN